MRLSFYVSREAVTANGQGLACCGGIWNTFRPDRCLAKVTKVENIFCC